MRGPAIVGCGIGLVLLGAAAGADDLPRARLELEAVEATVGDPLGATLILELAPGARFEPRTLGPEIGPFSVRQGAWAAPSAEDERQRWIWTGRLVAFRTGELEVPAIRLRVEGEGGALSVSTAPVGVTLQSVLTEDDLTADPPEISDLKPPASIAPRYGPLWAALGGVALLLAAATLVWWLHRRYAGRLAAVPAPEDPFGRTPPHVWIYAELKRLLARRLPEEGQVDRFYAELSRILKVYLGGRYRVDLLEHTTEELPEQLRQAGAPARAVDAVVALLQECDRVKFARHRPGAADWRDAVERIYDIVDTTKPVAEKAEATRRGAAA